MTASTASDPRTREQAILVRIWDELLPEKMSQETARDFLKLNFNKQDEARMRRLLRLNSDGKISKKQLAELDAYVVVGDVLALLHLKATRALGSAGRRARHA